MNQCLKSQCLKRLMLLLGILLAITFLQMTAEAAAGNCEDAKVEALEKAQKDCSSKQQDIAGNYEFKPCVQRGYEVTATVVYACLARPIAAGKVLSSEQAEACTNDARKFCDSKLDASCLVRSGASVSAVCHKRLGLRGSNMNLLGSVRPTQVATAVR